jgi:bifunctional non-homologous end joining protein LigD
MEKLDGWRLQAHNSGSLVTLLARGGFDCTRRLPDIAEALQSLPASSAILDGELVAIGEDGLPDFGALHRGDRLNLRFYVFDLLQHEDSDVRHEPESRSSPSMKRSMGAPARNTGIIPCFAH